MKRGIIGSTCLLFLVVVFLITSNFWVIRASDGKIFSSVGDIPYRKVALVLGTSKNSSFGGTNLYYSTRMEAAAALYLSGKVAHILVSGDNSRKEYDEGSDMKQSLLMLGVPDSCITIDYAGFRTLDSVVRAKEIFGLDSITIVSQEFHNQRAIFLSRHFGIDAIAYNAKDVNTAHSFKTKFREYFAKAKAVLDVKVFGTEPKYFGKKEIIK